MDYGTMKISFKDLEVVVSYSWSFDATLGPLAVFLHR
jgi:hypothetical protein